MKKIYLQEQQLNNVIETLLLENRLHDKAWEIAKKYYPNLTEPREPSGSSLIGTHNTKSVLLNKAQVEKIADELNRAQAYSTHNLNWLLEIMSQNSRIIASIYEDLDVYARYLRIFNENKSKIIAAGNKPDLWYQSGSEKVLNYKDKQELYNVIKPYFKSKETEGDMIYPKVKHYVETGDFDFVGETNTWYIVKIKKNHKEAVVDIQRGPSPDIKKSYTTWCTRVAGDHFDTYMAQAPLFMLINKHTAKTTNRDAQPDSMYQFHWGRFSQFKDRLDNEIEGKRTNSGPQAFWDKYPDVYNIFHEGVVDTIMSPNYTPLFSVNLENSGIPNDLQAMYKYKLESVIIPAMSEAFKLPEKNFNVIEYAKNGIYVSIKMGAIYDPNTGRKVSPSETYFVAPEISTSGFVIGSITGLKTLFEIKNLLNPNKPQTWVKYLDQEKFVSKLASEQSDLAFEIKKELIRTDYNLEKTFEKISLVDYPVQEWLKLIDPMDVVDKEKVFLTLKNPANTNLSIHIVELNAYVDFLNDNKFSPFGLTLKYFENNMIKTKLVATKLGG